ncbi:MAG TPA: GNAT family N-acetyltransferase [Chthoniobacterales bacterium]|nr:GNAT family N-acetyltransferase [Chthoniobacterales bacterium]
MPPFIFRKAEKADRDAVLKVVSSALLMERAWTSTSTDFSRDLEKRCERAFDGESPACMVVQHGSRVIGASVLDFSSEAEFHLITGPCILHEYRSRGFGSALLQHSLERLRDEGLKQANALVRVNSTSSRFVYPKFGGVAEPLPAPTEVVPRLAA